MPFVDAKCPNCGGELKLDDNLEKGFCIHCGTPFIYEHAINLIKLEKDMNIIGLQSFEDKLFNAQKLLTLKEYGKAELVFDKLTESYSSHYEIWMGLFYARTHNMKLVAMSFCEDIEKALECSKNDLKAVEEISEVNEKYHEMIRLKNEEQTEQRIQLLREGIKNKKLELESNKNALKQETREYNWKVTTFVIGHLVLLTGTILTIGFIRSKGIWYFTVLGVVIIIIILVVWEKLYHNTKYYFQYDSNTAKIEDLKRKIESEIEEIDINENELMH